MTLPNVIGGVEYRTKSNLTSEKYFFMPALTNGSSASVEIPFSIILVFCVLPMRSLRIETLPSRIICVGCFFRLSTGEIMRLHTKEGDMPLEFPLAASFEGEPSPYTFKKETYKNGDVYFGEFYDGRRHGYGVYQWANGDLWYGCYRGGYRDGYGMLVKPDHRVYYGKWVGDTKVE